MLVGKIPIFGICRGLQTLNVHFGGTLRNLWGHSYSSSDTHEVHKIKFPNNKGKEIKMGVNSFHHQAIDKLAENLTVEATSDEIYWNCIEAVSDYNNRIFAVQWHPERLWDKYSIERFSKLLD